MTEKNILVIGATGGVGLAIAKRLKETGYTVYLTCRSKTQKKSLESAGICRQALQMNLGNSRSIESAFEQLNQLGVRSLAACINCAAITTPAPLELMSIRDFQAIFQVNVFGTLQATQLAIPLLREGRGRLIMVGSVGGNLSLPLLGAYSASKFALEAMCDSLRRELTPWQIPVSLVKPGAIQTNMTVRHIEELKEIIRQPVSGIAKRYIPFYKSHLKRMEFGFRNGVTAERVAEDIFSALTDKKPKARYYVGLEPTLLSSLSKFIPDKLQDKLLEQLFPER